MSAATDFKAQWRAFRFPNGKQGFVGATGEKDHFMILSGGGLWTSFNVGRPFFLPWITMDGAGHGNFTAMVHLRDKERNVWAGMQKLVKAEFRDERPFGIVEAAGEYADGTFAYRLHVRFTFAGGCPGFLTEVTALENIGTVELNAPAVYLKANAGGGERAEPLPDENGWLYPDGRKTVVTAVEGGAVKFWLQKNGYAHPDVDLKTGDAVIAPGAIWRPSTPRAAVYRFEPFTEDGK